MSARSRLAGATLQLVVLLGSGCASGDGDNAAPTDETSADPTSASEIVATWSDRVPIKRQDYESWRIWRDLPDEPSSLTEFAGLTVLAHAARARADSTRGPTPAQIERRVRLLVLGEALIEHLGAQAQVSEAEIDAALREKPDAFSQPKKYMLSSLFLTLPESPTDAQAVRARLQALRERIQAGEDFGTIAARESESQSRFRNGRIGRVSLDQLPSDVAVAIEPLAPGELSAVVESGGGLAIYLCERIDEAVVHPPEVVREKVRSALARHKGRQAIRTLDAELLAADGLHEDSPDAERRLAELRAERAESLGLGESDEVRNGLRWRTLQQLAIHERDRRVAQLRSEPDSAMLRQSFEAHQTKGKGMERFRVAGIAFGVPSGVALEQARKVLRQLEQGELSFEQAARSHSIDESAAAGGDLGWFDIRRLAARDWSLMRAIRSIDEGDLTGIITSGNDLWIYRLVERQEGSEVRFEDVVQDLRSAFRQSETRRLQRAVHEQVARDLVLH